MKKSLLALAVLGAFAGAASAQSSVTLYGRVDLSVGKGAGVEAKSLADDLICLLEEAPLGKRARIDHLIDRYEALRISCLS